MAKQNGLSPHLKKKLEWIKEDGKEILERRKDYFRDLEKNVLTDVGSAIIDENSIVLEYSGEAFNNLDIDEKLKSNPFERIIYAVDRRNFYHALDEAFQHGVNNFVMSAGLRMGDTSFYTHYDISGRAIRAIDATKKSPADQQIAGFSIALRRALTDINTEVDATSFPSLNKACPPHKEIISELKRIGREATESKRYNINFRYMPSPISEEIVGIAGESYANNKFISLIGTSILPPIYYTEIRDIAHKLKRSIKTLGLQEVSIRRN